MDITFPSTVARDILEDEVLGAAHDLGGVREQRATEYVRLVAAGTKSWDAQHMVDAEYSRKLAMAEATYEVMLERLRRAR